jgi:riboflavin kinase/FMN adenylyltransferase
VIPARGVYVTRTQDLDSARAWTSVTNIGYRPTFGESDQLTIETYLLEPLLDAQTPGETLHRIRVEFLARLRSERKFESAEALKAQILRDVGSAKSYFRRTQAWIASKCPPPTS